MSAGEGLRSQVMAGVMALGAREIVGLVIRFGGVLVLVRLLGPELYGVYVGPMGIIVLLTMVAQLSQETYLVRGVTEPSKRKLDTSFTLLLMSTALVTALAAAIVTTFLHLLPDPRMVGVFLVLLPCIPLGALWAPAQAAMERSFRFGRVGVVEVASDLLMYLVAVPLVLLGFGYWAPAAGLLTMTAAKLVGGYVMAHYRPWVVVDRQGLRLALSYGVRYVGVYWVSTMRWALNGLIVGHTLGATAVGLVGVAIRLVDVVGFLSRAALRVAAVAVAKVQADPPRLARAVERAVEVQILVVGGVLFVFTIVSPLAVELMYGDEWLPVVQIIPFLAAAAVVQGSAAIGMVVLTTKDRLLYVAIVQYARLALTVPLAFALSTAFGAPGYAGGELLGMLPVALLPLMLRQYAPVRSLPVAVLLAAVLPLLFLASAPEPVNLLLLAPAVLVLLWPSMRRHYWDVVLQLWEAFLDKLGGLPRLAYRRAEPASEHSHVG